MMFRGFLRGLRQQKGQGQQDNNTGKFESHLILENYERKKYRFIIS